MTNELQNTFIHALEAAVKIGFTGEQIGVLSPVMYQILETMPDAWQALANDLLVGEDDMDKVYAITRSLGLEDDLGMLAVCLLLTEASHRYYREHHIDEEIYWASMRDIWVWTQTCIENRHHLGVYQYGWIHNFWTAKIVRLGRLEFHIIEYEWEQPCTLGDITLHKGDPVINTHIPADGHLDPAAVQDSFCRAYRYFGKTGITPIVCHSWLLYPKNRLFCATDSRILSFMENFTIISELDRPDSGDLWRVFGVRDSYEPDTLPETTPLQRQLKKHLRNGGTMGLGYGVLLHDGKEIVHI